MVAGQEDPFLLSQTFVVVLATLYVVDRTVLLERKTVYTGH